MIKFRFSDIFLNFSYFSIINLFIINSKLPIIISGNDISKSGLFVFYYSSLLPIEDLRIYVLQDAISSATGVIVFVFTIF